MDTIIENGKIADTALGIDFNGIMTFYIYIEFKKFFCTYGGYALDEYKTENKKRKGTSYGMQKIMDILDCLGVSHWEDLKGKYVRCEHKKSGEIIRIGNIIEDKWFSM